MKKNLLMVALVASATSFAAVTGTFKLNTENGTKHERTYSDENGKVDTRTYFKDMISHVTTKVNTETELKLGDSGVSLGAKVGFNYNPFPEKFGDKYLANNVNLNGKYDIDTKVEGLKSYVKLGTSFDLGSVKNTYKNGEGKYTQSDLITPLKDAELEKTDGTVKELVAEFQASPKLNGEFGLSYEKSGITYGLMTKSEATLNAIDFTSTHELKISGKHGKLTDFLARLEVGHGWEFGADNKLKSPVYVQGELKAEGQVMEGLKLGVRDLITTNFISGEEKEVETSTIGKFKHAQKTFSNLLSGKLTFTKDDYEVSGTGMLDYKFNEIKDHLIGYGVKLEGKYTGVKKLTLSADALFAGKSEVKINNPTTFTNKGNIKLNAEAKYDLEATEKLTLSPKANVSVNLEDITKEKVTKVGLTLTPSLEAKLKANDKVTLTSSFETPVKFSLDGSAKDNKAYKQSFAYRETGFTAKLGLEYKF